jgi:hypothetical protein
VKQLSGNENVVELTVVYNEVEANLIKSILEDADIDCLLVTDVPHSVYPFTISGLGRVRIKVLSPDLKAAQQALLDARTP